MSIKQAIEELFDTLEEIQIAHSEMDDTAVREVLQQHIYWGLRKPVDIYEVNEEFKMFTQKGNILLQEWTGYL